MASFLTTMFVPFHSSPSAKPLPPHCTLKQSSSCVTLDSYTTLEPPGLPPNLSSPPSTPSRALDILRDKWGDHVSSPCSDRELSPFSNARTRGQFKPSRGGKANSSFQLRQFAEATLGSGSLRKAVKLPEGEDLNEWLAVNGKMPYQTNSTCKIILTYTFPVVDFYNQINLLYGSITEFCSPQACPEMKATDE
jgi:MOB kinase activator 1